MDAHDDNRAVHAPSEAPCADENDEDHEQLTGPTFDFTDALSDLLPPESWTLATTAEQERAVKALDETTARARATIERLDGLEAERRARECAERARAVASACVRASAALARARRALIKAGIVDESALAPFDPDA